MSPQLKTSSSRKLDLSQAFYQVPVDEASKDLLAFTVPSTEGPNTDTRSCHMEFTMPVNSFKQRWKE